MRIGIFCDTFYPENKAIAIRLFHFAEELAKVSGVTVHTSTRATAHKSLPYRVVQNVLPAPSNESSNLVRLIAELLLGMEMFFRILFCRYDAIVITSPPFFAAVMGTLASRMGGIPYVFDVRDEYPEVFFTAGVVKEKSFFGKLLLRAERMVYRHALLVLTVTEGICQRIDVKSGKQGRATLVRNGFDRDLFVPGSQKGNQFTVVFHGNLGKFQDPELIIKVARCVHERDQNIRFKVIGFGNNDESIRVSNQPNVEFIGQVPYHEIPKIIASAHLGISFRSDDIISYNSFPVKLYEYIGIGIPVIVTPVSEAGHFFETFGIGFQYGNTQVEEIASRIVELAQDNVKYEGISKRIADIRERFSRQGISREFATQFLEALKTSKRNG